MRKYHFIIFFGGYANHTYLDSWTINHNLNLSFYTDTGALDLNYVELIPRALRLYERERNSCHWRQQLHLIASTAHEGVSAEPDVD